MSPRHGSQQSHRLIKAKRKECFHFADPAVVSRSNAPDLILTQRICNGARSAVEDE